jgi:hypothetical protein
LIGKKLVDKLKNNNMGIPNKQIGWSQESNLLWQISNQLDQLIKVTGALANAITTTTTTTAAP